MFLGEKEVRANSVIYTRKVFEVILMKGGLDKRSRKRYFLISSAQTGVESLVYQVLSTPAVSTNNVEAHNWKLRILWH